MKAKTIITQYFKSLFLILFAAVVLLACSLIGMYLFSDRTVMLILTGLFLLAVIVFNLPMIVYYFRVRIEWKKEDFCCQTIIIHSIERARFHNYYYRGGILVDEGKSVLIDKEDNKYHFIGGSSLASKYLSMEVLKITYLRKTGFLISAELMSESPGQELRNAFTRCFYYYTPEAVRGQFYKKYKGHKKRG